MRYAHPLGVLCLALPAIGQAATISTMTPAQPLSEARVATLPAAQRASWTAYLARSRALMAADKAVLQAEHSNPAGTPARPHPAAGDGDMPLHAPAAWYGTPEALRVADNILSFQTPAGGWGKNADRAGPPRRPGEPWVPLDIGQRKASWNYVGTIDNGATVTEMRFLARVQAHARQKGEACRAAFLEGLRYLLRAQYPHGGFPQVYPLQGGYHDAVTLNDDAMVKVVELLLEAGNGQDDYAFVPPALAGQARAAAQRAVGLLVATQQRAGGKRTGWGQQVDALSLELAGARNFEPAALASSESTGVLLLLMRLPDPSPEVQEAVHGGIAWLRSAALRDVAWQSDTPGGGRRLVRAPGAGAIWSRYYDARSFKPVFGDRDRSIHDDVNELSIERRNGYAWFVTVPSRAIERYASWSLRYPAGGE
ncbi:pectate lyase [Massilia consociata]|uniref:Pectate lyase n=1 Tax=Massilia consociata TaxID=760117 RepID=A0ABV6FA52_9BURK